MRPDIYFFNLTCELAIANGSPYYTAPALLRKFEADLGYLPGWLGDEKDQVLVQGIVDPGFSDKMNSLGFRLPGYLNSAQALADPEWTGMDKGFLRPWGWSPALCHMFRNAVPQFHADFRNSAVANWLPVHKRLYSRLTALEVLNDLLRKSEENWLPCFQEIPVVCNNIEQIQIELKRHEKAVVKSPWSSSGRGLLLFPNVDSKRKNDELLTGMLNQQGFVTVEPWLENVADLSYQFYAQAGKIIYRGRTFFETDSKGRYVRTFLKDHPNISDEVHQFIGDHNSEVVAMLLEALSKSDYSTDYEGWIGVDSMIYQAAGGSYKFHPMVEINGRYTMGAVAMRMGEHLAPESHGFMQVFYSKKSSFHDFCRQQENEKPLVLEDQKIVRGFLPLTPPLPEHQFGVYIEVES